MKILNVVVLWGLIFFVYVILGATIPVHLALVNESSAMLTAGSNMTRYPGTLGAIQVWPVVVWFIPGGIGIAATAIYLREDIANLRRG